MMIISSSSRRSFTGDAIPLFSLLLLLLLLLLGAASGQHLLSVVPSSSSALIRATTVWVEYPHDARSLVEEREVSFPLRGDLEVSQVAIEHKPVSLDPHSKEEAPGLDMNWKLEDRGEEEMLQQGRVNKEPAAEKKTADLKEAPEQLLLARNEADAEAKFGQFFLAVEVGAIALVLLMVAGDEDVQRMFQEFQSVGRILNGLGLIA